MAKIISLRSGPVIPYELIELIIELVATENDVDTLLALALLNYHFCWVARRYIFSYIPLEKWKYRDPAEGQTINEAEHFRRILHHTPKIATLVRKFDYVNDLQNKQDAPAVFRRLYNVTSFTFGFNDYEAFGPKQANWATDISLALRQSICSFLQVNNLRSLQMLNIVNIPGMLFELLPCLEELDLHAVSFSDIGSDPRSAQDFRPVMSAENAWSNPVRLNSLTLRRKMDTGFSYLMSAKGRNGRALVDYSQVATAHFHIEHPNMTSTLLEFLRQTENLTDLTFGGYCGEFDIKKRFTASLNPSSYHTLRRLEFWYMVDGRQYDPFGGLAHELADLACRAHGVVMLPLEEVTVSIQIDTDGSCDTSPDVWSKLDAVLSEPGRFPCLQKVNIRVSIHYCREVMLGILVQDLNNVGQMCFNGLRELQKQRSLDFTFKITKKPV